MSLSKPQFLNVSRHFSGDIRVQLSMRVFMSYNVVEPHLYMSHGNLFIQFNDGLLLSWNLFRPNLPTDPHFAVY